MESRKIIKSSEASCERLGAQAAHCTQSREQGGGPRARRCAEFAISRTHAEGPLEFGEAADDDGENEAKVACSSGDALFELSGKRVGCGAQ